MRNRLARWQRTFHTIRHLQPRQAWYFFLRRVIGSGAIKPSNHKPVLQRIELHPVLQLAHRTGEFSNYEFRFLNHTLRFPHAEMNWCPQEAQRLWRYNLHYFDFLREPTRPLQQKRALIDDWIANNPQVKQPAWEPYTTSLRIVNWCLFFWSLPREQIDDGWLLSLHTQARWLERNLELHILANHYFENIKAMLFAALFFDDDDSARWLRHFQSELTKQLREQTLSDGGHYERSPQYHSILLDDYLDLYALLHQNSEIIKPETLTTLTSVIDAGLCFLATITTPDDDIPLFNDSASGTAPRPSALFAKARRLGFNIEIPQTTLIDLPDSGLFGWRAGGDYFLIDCGDIGPPYQPGHTHCDLLSFVLMINKEWLVVDSGVCEYEPGAMRSYVRSTQAHNTVQINGQEQSEIWGEFRVGRRAQSLGASIKREGNSIIFEGAYAGFPNLAASITHRRCVVLTLTEHDGIQSIEVIDSISGRSSDVYRLENMLHLHPSITCSTSNDSFVEVGKGSENIASIDGLSISRSTKSWYCPEFGLAIPNQMLCTVSNTSLPTKLSYRIAIIPEFARLIV